MRLLVKTAHLRALLKAGQLSLFGRPRLRLPRASGYAGGAQTTREDDPMTTTEKRPVKAHMRHTKAGVVPVAQHQRATHVTRDEVARAAAQREATREHETEKWLAERHGEAPPDELEIPQGPWFYKPHPEAESVYAPPGAEELDGGVLRMGRPLSSRDRQIYRLLPADAEGSDRPMDVLERAHQADGTREVFAVLKSRWGEFEKRLKTLQKKAEKWGLQPPELQVLGRGLTKIPVELIGWGSAAVTKYENREAVIAYVHAPELVVPGGWKLRAVITPEAEGHNVVGKVGNDEGELPRFLWSTGTHCDHCNTTRNRAQMFALENDKGDWQQVGRSCLADYKGLSAASAASAASYIANWWKQLDDDDGWLEKGSKGAGGAQIKDVLLASVQRVDMDGGYIAKSKEDATLGIIATATSVAEDLFGKRSGQMRARAAAHAGYQARADAIQEWMRNLPPQSNDYMANLRAIGQAEGVKMRRVGLVASAVTAYDRAMEHEAAEQHAAAARGTLQHFGAPGDKIGTKLTAADKRKNASLHPPQRAKIRRMHHYESQYGSGTILIMEDDKGHVFKWAASGSLAYQNGAALEAEYGTELPESMRFQVGDTVDVEGSIKRHSTYKDTPQTEITRGKLSRVLTDAERGFLENQIRVNTDLLDRRNAARRSLWGRIRSAAERYHAEGATDAVQAMEMAIRDDTHARELADVDSWAVRNALRFAMDRPAGSLTDEPPAKAVYGALEIWDAEKMQRQAARGALEALQAFSARNAHQPLAKATRLVVRPPHKSEDHHAR